MSIQDLQQNLKDEVKRRAELLIKLEEDKPMQR